MKFEPLGILNFGLQKRLDNGARLSFTVSDVLNSLERTGITDLTNENLYVRRTFDFSQRTFKLTYSATFGNRKMKQSRNRNSGSDEKNRVN